jgi:nucleoside phosphorylase
MSIVSRGIRDHRSPRSSRHHSRATGRSVAAAAALALLFAGRASAASPAHGLCAAATDQTPTPPYLAVLSAFPAELAPLVAAAEIEETVEVAGHSYYTGTLDGVSVILGLTGIGMVNAERTAENVLTSFDVAGLVVSGVAGSHHRIGDVVVPDRWRERRRRFRVNRALLALAQRGATALEAPLERCTAVPPTDPDAEIVCLPFDPAIVFGGHGSSGDSFGDTAVPCLPDGGEVLGCDLPTPDATGFALHTAAQHTLPDVQDMETAAVARVARRHRVPFLAVRAVSDGAGDPLGDRGFPEQFFDYYRLAAENAGLITRALVGALGQLARDEPSRHTCDLLAKGRWRRAAKLILAPLAD